MFRCPHCAAIYKLPLSENYSLVASYQLDKFVIKNERVYKEGIKTNNFATQILAYEREVNDLQEAFRYVQEKGEETYYNLPIECPACHKEALLANWKEAFEDPISIFGTEHLCRCGNELWMDRIPGTNKYVMICDSCKWYNKNTIVSGSSDVHVK